MDLVAVVVVAVVAVADDGDDDDAGDYGYIRIKGRPHYYSAKREEYAQIKFDLDAGMSSNQTKPTMATSEQAEKTNRNGK